MGQFSCQISLIKPWYNEAWI